MAATTGLTEAVQSVLSCRLACAGNAQGPTSERRHNDPAETGIGFRRRLVVDDNAFPFSVNGGLLAHLLQDRARDRAREDEQLRRSRSGHHD